MRWGISVAEAGGRVLIELDGGCVRGAGWRRGIWRSGILIGLLGLPVVLAAGERTLAVGFQQTPAAGGSSHGPKSYRRGSSRQEPARVRAARRFLARRGIGPGSLRAGNVGRGIPSANAARRTALRLKDTNQSARNPAPVLAQAAGTPVWTAAGPVGVNSLEFGLVTGRVSAIAFDPSDATGNHVLVGTTGGGLWQSQNAAASTPASVQFLPLTDDLGALSGAAEIWNRYIRCGDGAAGWDRGGAGWPGRSQRRPGFVLRRWIAALDRWRPHMVADRADEGFLKTVWADRTIPSRARPVCRFCVEHEECAAGGGRQVSQAGSGWRGRW